MQTSAMKKSVSLSQAVAALKHRNFRLFWFGQCISLIGTWMQNVAQSWLVLEITHSAFWLGVVGAVQFVPVLLFSLHAGTLIDRFPKKQMLIFTQVSLMIFAFLLALDTFWGTVTLTHVVVLAVLLGCVNTLDMPTRQSFMVELVGKADLMNAIVLNSAIFNAARVIGPTIAGLLIARIGMDWCFFLNAVSFIPVIIGILFIDLKRSVGMERLERPVRQSVTKDIKLGLSYVKNTQNIFIALVLLVIINIFAMNFRVIIPLFAKDVFHEGAEGFGLLMSAMGIGAILGSMVLAFKSRQPKFKTLAFAALGLSFAQFILVWVTNFVLAYALVAVTGMSMITFTTTTNSMLQTQAPNHLRGRVMSIYTLLFAGLTPIGSFMSGTIAHGIGVQATLGVETSISLMLIFWIVFRNRRLWETA